MWMNCIQKQTHFSIPFTMIVVWMCVCAPFWNATLNLFGQSETVWDKDLVLAHRPPNNLCSRIPFLLYFCLLLTTHLFTLGDPYHYLKLIKDTFFSLQCCALLYPNRIAYNTALKTWLSVCLFFFLSMPSGMYQHCLKGGKWLIQSSASSKQMFI